MSIVKNAGEIESFEELTLKKGHKPIGPVWDLQASCGDGPQAALLSDRRRAIRTTGRLHVQSSLRPIGRLRKSKADDKKAL